MSAQVFDEPDRLQRTHIQLPRALGTSARHCLDGKPVIWTSMLRQYRTMTLASHGLLYVLLTIFATLWTTFAYPQTIVVSDAATVDSISGNPSTTLPADDSGSAPDDDSGSDTLDVIGNQSLGVQFGGGFVVGCIIGVLCYIMYRIISNCVRRRSRGGRNRVGGGTHDNPVENGLEAGGP